MPKSLHQGQRLRVLLRNNKIEKNYIADRLGISYAGFAYYYKLERLSIQIKERVYPLLEELGLNPDFIESAHASEKLEDARPVDDIRIGYDKQQVELLKEILSELREMNKNLKK